MQKAWFAELSDEINKSTEADREAKSNYCKELVLLEKDDGLTPLGLAEESVCSFAQIYHGGVNVGSCSDSIRDIPKLYQARKRYAFNWTLANYLMLQKYLTACSQSVGEGCLGRT